MLVYVAASFSPSQDNVIALLNYTSPKQVHSQLSTYALIAGVTAIAAAVIVLVLIRHRKK